MEIFKILKDYPNYEVSNNGNVRRVGKMNNLKPIDNGKGYKTVHLSNDKGRKLCLIHRLVMTTFESIKELMDVNHKDGDKANNSLLNLEWITKSDNTRHAHKTGLFSSRNKLTIDQVLYIKSNKTVVTARELALKFNVQTSVIYKIWLGQLYPYV